MGDNLTQTRLLDMGILVHTKLGAHQLPRGESSTKRRPRVASSIATSEVGLVVLIPGLTPYQMCVRVCLSLS